MGWFSWHFASDTTLASFMKEFEEKLAEASEKNSDNVTIEVRIKGDTEENLTFNAGSAKDLRKMVVE